jgi:hypothetical protein
MRWVGIGGVVGAVVNSVVDWPGLRFWQGHVLGAPSGRGILYTALLIAAGMGMGALVSRMPDKRWVGAAGVVGALLGLVISWPLMRGSSGILVTFDDPRHGAMLFAVALGLVGMVGVALVHRFLNLAGQSGNPARMR